MTMSSCRKPSQIEYSAEQGNKIECNGVQSRKKAFGAIKDGMTKFKKRRKSRS